jgi:phosphohistidine phosphatase
VPALLLLRHAKSDWTADSGDDRARPLNRRGRKASATIGELIARADQVPDSAIASPAVRARETLELVMAAGGWTCPVRAPEALYDSGMEGLLSEIRAEPAETGVLLAVGHEPTWSDAAASLIGGGNLDLPTAALVRINFEIDRWDEVGPGAGVLAWMVVPRLLERS